MTFDADYDSLTAEGTCTACDVKEDKSAYWTPAMYFQYKNGTTVMVPQIGGMLAYYLYYLDKVQAFEEGFQMLAGNPWVRNFTGPFPDTELSFWPTDASGDDEQFFLQQRAIGFNCLNYDLKPEPSLYRHVMPSKEYMDQNCKNGMRLEMGFPSCGNGSKTSSDHQSHMKYPSLVKEGNCPDGYDVHYPFLFYETIWGTDQFAGEDGDFMLSYGDPVGAGYHADFIMGWESQDFLQQALDTCTNQSGEISDCPLFTIDRESPKDCKFETPKELKDDDCHGPRDGLPVDVPIQYGPELATKYPIAGRKGHQTTGIENTAAPSTYTEMPTLTYSPLDPQSSKSAMGGIVVAKYSSGADGDYAESQATGSETPESWVSPQPSSQTPQPSPETTAAPASSEQPEFEATSYLTNGNTVVELFIDEVDVTVTATSTATQYEKRHGHAHHHAHRDFHHR